MQAHPHSSPHTTPDIQIGATGRLTLVEADNQFNEARFARYLSDSVAAYLQALGVHPDIMTTTEAFGFIVVVVMVISYALEDRSHWLILLFAIACLGAAAYAALIRSLPFALVETVWSGIAFARWTRRRSRELTPDTR
jgi:hypothetical protein